MLEKGGRAPEFELSDAEGKVWKLSDLRGRRIILYFYPADDTPGCTAEACDFRDSLGRFEAAGYLVLGVSPQEADSHREFSGKHNLNFPLLIDTDLSAATAYSSLRSDGADYKGTPLRVARSTFVIDADGIIEQAHYGISARGHVATLKETLGVP